MAESADRLPRTEEEFEEWASRYEPEDVFAFLGLVRSEQGRAAGVAGQMRTKIARTLVQEFLIRNRGADMATARREVSRRLGYTATTMSNFTRILEGVARQSRTPRYGWGEEEL